MERKFHRLRGAGGWVAVLAVSCGIVMARQIDGITFATTPGKIYLPLDEASRELHWPLRQDRMDFQMNARPLDAGGLRRLVDGTVLVSVDELAGAGAELVSDEQGQVEVLAKQGSFTISAGAKRVEVSLAEQQLRAWQGDRLVLSSHISSGRQGRTPAGNFQAGPYKARMHYSSLYQNAPMPWSVQINRHVFIHGFTSVPNYPASHGCIRLPLTKGNPAKFFYDWTDTGTPVKVTRG